MNFENVKNLMEYLTSWRIPGNSVCVYKDGKEVFRHSTGYSDLENKIAMTDDRLMYIYSCSKVTTVTAALQLFEKGRFLLDDPLGAYIPEFEHMSVKGADGEVVDAKNPITVRNLFTMTAGFDYNFGRDAFLRARELTGGKMNTLETIRCVASEPLCFNPGEKWQYSICHDVLAALVEAVSGMKFSEYVKKNIFEPLEMNDSFYHADDKLKGRMAQQYEYFENANAGDDIVELQRSGARSDGSGYVKNIGKSNNHILGDEYDSGGAGIITTVPDYAKLAAALAGFGVGANGERILSKATVELMREPQLTLEQSKYFNWEQFSGYEYALGVKVMCNRAKGGALSSLGEFSWGGAAGGTIFVDPSENLGVFYAHHMINPQEPFYQPRLRNALYSCL